MNKFPLLPEEENLLESLQEILGIKIKNKLFFLSALTHPSYVGRLKILNRPIYTYERLEFLGDAVLELVVSDFLFRRYKKQPEGILSATRAYLVNEKALANTSRRLQLYKYVFAGKSFVQKIKKSEHVLSDILESIIGAIYLDRGLRYAKRFIINKHLSALDIYKIIRERLFLDPKTRLQELVQKAIKLTPVYDTAEIANSSIRYKSCVKINNVTVACAQGATKLEAEFKAAAKTLELLKNKKLKLDKIISR